MNKRKIHIFLASSITDLPAERDALELFIRQLSDQLEERYDTKIMPLRCETVDNAMTLTGSQAKLDAMIRESELCLFIFFRKVGDVTVHEFDVAREQFAQTGKPKIYTYFKKLKNGETAEESVRAFMRMLDEELSHYYTIFDHIDTVKLRILLSLKLEEMDFISVSFEGGKCVVDGVAMVDLSHVSEFANNKMLRAYEAEYAEVNGRYLQMRPVYEKGGYDETFGAEYVKVASRRQMLLDMMEDLHKRIFEVSLGLCRDEARGEITQRQREAYRLFEQGDYEGCMAVLNADDMDGEFRREKKRMREELRRKAALYIREHRTAIEILNSWVENPNRFSEIERRYAAIVPEAEEQGVELDVLLDYALYLYWQNQHAKALEIGERLLVHYESGAVQVEEWQLGYLYHCLGTIADALPGRQAEAERYYLNAIDVAKRLAEEDPEQFEPELAMSCNNIGIFYHNQGDREKAERFFLYAIAIRERLVAEDPAEFEPDLAVSYNNIGAFYAAQGDLDKTERYFLRAIAIRERLAEEDPAEFEEALAVSYNNIGIFYDRRGDGDKAEEYHLAAIAIWKRLTEGNPERFEPNLATGYNNMGDLYNHLGDMDRAERCFLEAIAIWERLVRGNPERFEPDLVVSYNNIGAFYSTHGHADKAERYWIEVIAILERLTARNPGRFEHELAASCNNTGMFYQDHGAPEQAEAYYLRAMAIRERLAQREPERFEPLLAESYYLYAGLKDDPQYREAALTLARKYPHDPVCRDILEDAGE